MILHQGLALRKGHYASICFNRELQQWLYFNDSKVTAVNENDVVNESEAYMLFYEQK